MPPNQKRNCCVFHSRPVLIRTLTSVCLCDSFSPASFSCAPNQEYRPGNGRKREKGLISRARIWHLKSAPSLGVLFGCPWSVSATRVFCLPATEPPSVL